MSGFFDGDGKRALATAIPAFERTTSPELVITVRPRSDPYWHVSVNCVRRLEPNTAMCIFSSTVFVR